MLFSLRVLSNGSKRASKAQSIFKFLGVVAPAPIPRWVPTSGSPWPAEAVGLADMLTCGWSPHSKYQLFLGYFLGNPVFQGKYLLV